MPERGNKRQQLCFLDSKHELTRGNNNVLQPADQDCGAIYAVSYHHFCIFLQSLPAFFFKAVEPLQISPFWCAWCTKTWQVVLGHAPSPTPSYILTSFAQIQLHLGSWLVFVALHDSLTISIYLRYLAKTCTTVTYCACN